jgi:predicted ArsR family transcriptional regulator
MVVVFHECCCNNDGMTTMLVDAPPPVPAGTRREQVLGLLRSSAAPRSVAEVAEATGLHLNTARFHLDALVKDQLAERLAEPREVPGRPRILYSAQGPQPGPRSYALLAEMLTGLVSSFKGGEAATVEAGRAWGKHLVDRPAPSEQVDAEEAVARLNRMLDAIGFQPEAGPGKTKRDTDVQLHHCPFREVAQRHNDVVCTIHLGLMQGALEALHAPVEATALEPFVRPNLCIARLRTTATTSRAAARGRNTRERNQP